MSHGPNDQATQWLLDKMHDPHVSLRHRIECAKTLLEIHPEEFRIRWVRDPRDESVVTLKVVDGGIPAEQHPPRLADPDQNHIADNHSPARLNYSFGCALRGLETIRETGRTTVRSL